MSQTKAPPDLELQALSVLWIHGPSTVSTVIELFPDGRERAYTTILSVMQSLEKKKFVKSTRDGRANIYTATKSQQTVMRPLALEFVNHAFGGSVGDAISSLLSAAKLTPEEKTALGRELKEHKAMAKKKTAKKKTSKKKAAPVRKVAKKAPKKAVKKKVTKKASKKKVAKKVTKKVAKKVTKKAPKKATKKSAKKKVVRKTAKKAVKKKTAKKASKKKTARKR